MADIHIARPGGSRLWLWTTLLALAGIGVWVAAAVWGDPTEQEGMRGVGAAAGFGADRAPVIPIEPLPFEQIDPIGERDVGTLVRFTGSAASAVRANSVWAASVDGRRILLRFQPPPEGGARLGGRLELNGYLRRISRAEFDALADTLGVSLPRPPGTAKFGAAPDSAFMEVDSRYIKTFYISVRPEAYGQSSRAAGVSG
ncbi:MAG: hypothetical protein ACREKN_09220 [Longimicrobiaceae bacterium]